MNFKSLFSLFLALIITSYCFAQSQTKSALFLGNSYTYYNNMPLLIENIALSMGDTLIYDSNTPGGYTFEGHSTNVTSTAKIMQGTWDFVILQEQSQLPSFPIAQVETQVLPFAMALDELINEYNECAETMFYMTWGRKNGDAQNCPFWTPVCTYEGMDDLLNERYQLMAALNDAVVSPVGAVWRYIRTNHPEIELYAADESHPSPAGSYAAACAFYTSIFRKSPLEVSYNYTLSATDANNIKAAVNTVVYEDLLNWNIGEYDVQSDFSAEVVEGFTVSFENNSTNAESYSWDFGDGNTSDEMNPSHTYNSEGLYMVTLTAFSLCDSAEFLTEVNVMVSASEQINQGNFNIYPNPAKAILFIKHPIKSNVNVALYNQIGQIVLNKENLKNNEFINLESLPTGIYHLIIEDNNGQLYFKKIAKQ